MTTSVNVNRQSVLSASRDFTYDDFVSGTAKPLIYLRPGTRILRGWVDITTAWVSASTNTYSVGDTEGTDDVDRWLTSTNAKTAALTALLAPLKASTIDTAEAVTMTLTDGAAPTAGAGTLYIEYVEEPRVSEYNTYRG